MFNLKYKFKKILRFINKILRVILIFGCIASLLCIVAFADIDYKYTFKEFLEINGSDFLAYRRPLNGYINDDNPTPYTWTNDYNLTLSGVSIPVAYGLRVITNPSGSDYISNVAGSNYFMFKNPTFTYQFASNSASASNDDFQLKFTFHFSDVNGSYHSVSVYDGVASSIYHSGSTYVVYFSNIEFDFVVPSNYSRLHYFDIDIYSGIGCISGSNVTINSSQITFFIGDKASAPIYPEYDSNTPDNIASMEDAALEDAAEGLDEVGSFINQFENIFYNGGPTVAGLQFIGMFMNDLYLQIPWLNILLVISLSLGIVTVILGVFNIVKKGR